MKLGTIANVNFQNAVRSLLASKLPVKTSWKITKAVNKMEKELKTYEEIKNNLIKEFADKNEDGTLKTESMAGQQVVLVPEPNRAAFFAKVKELEEVEIDLQKVKLDELEGASLSPNELLYLGELVEE